MDNLQENIRLLYDRWLKNEATPEEEQQLALVLHDEAGNRQLQDLLKETWENSPEEHFPDLKINSMADAILARYGGLQREADPAISRPGLNRQWAWMAAASVILIVGLFIGIRNAEETKKASSKQSAIAAKPAIDIQPGKNGAVLTLANGSRVVLDSLASQVVATQNGIRAILQDGKLSYSGSGEAAAALLYNNVSTPKGRQFYLVLPDGTKVWLNAASSISFPVAFTANERKVAITGEVYFEVTQDAQKPFVVNIDDRSEVQVLGTHFNVNAYKEESSYTTTLLEGSVAVRSDQENRVVLKPGQQAQIDERKRDNIKVTGQVNIDQVMAWKNGLFNFTDAHLSTVMNQLARWYDVDITYAGTVPDRVFYGEITRDLTLSQLLLLFKDINITYRIEGRSLILMP